MIEIALYIVAGYVILQAIWFFGYLFEDMGGGSRSTYRSPKEPVFVPETKPVVLVEPPSDWKTLAIVALIYAVGLTLLAFLGGKLA